MNINDAHLCYCLNIHCGESLSDIIQAIKYYAAAVKRRVCPNMPFGLGLRLSKLAADELKQDLLRFHEGLDRAGMYVFTVNGFAFGRFHDAQVKENVYLPDWSSTDRLDYTVSLAEILATLLPDDISEGSISTVPVNYGKAIHPGAVDNLLECARKLKTIHSKTGKKIMLALEPEPDCFLETSYDVIRFWEDYISPMSRPLHNYLGICVDACHASCCFERPADYLKRICDAGISVPKIQISAALSLSVENDVSPRLELFADDVYLHQVRVRTSDGIQQYPDLLDAITATPAGDWRVHYHVPIYKNKINGSSSIETTSYELDRDFFQLANTPGRHLEIETYTFNIIPGQTCNAIASITSEYEFVIEGCAKERGRNNFLNDISYLLAQSYPTSRHSVFETTRYPSKRPT
jgi:hypothetical protein